jgi:hypothetical protein
MEGKSVDLSALSTKDEASVDRGGGVIGVVLHRTDQLKDLLIGRFGVERSPGGDRARGGGGGRRSQSLANGDFVVDRQPQRMVNANRSLRRLENGVHLARRALGAHMFD